MNSFFQGSLISHFRLLIKEFKHHLDVMEAFLMPSKKGS
ncbi:hypothetical protein LptCag_2214 [Leptospirillum ferriphilum]|uniref:Uncharacterized protein n=1 Tax=Leptospirillum ferriphilum TaxID=178606 RepID=A0A094X8B7_9BACT|nr:hypothetical protein LptCag_2214 [Leptospirillum ferriphilum]